MIGTALGVYKCASNIGATLVSPIVGVVQDYFENEYTEVMLILTAFSVLASLGSLAFIVVDRLILRGLLSVGAEKRKAMTLSKSYDDVAPRASIPQTYAYGFVTTVLLVASWAVYISLALTSGDSGD